ncbi:hypothetical protein BC938DRAFT_474926, partial [Jimgerdemannia flammicorona]
SDDHDLFLGKPHFPIDIPTSLEPQIPRHKIPTMKIHQPPRILSKIHRPHRLPCVELGTCTWRMLRHDINARLHHAREPVFIGQGHELRLSNGIGKADEDGEGEGCGWRPEWGTSPPIRTYFITRLVSLAFTSETYTLTLGSKRKGYVKHQQRLRPQNTGTHMTGSHTCLKPPRLLVRRDGLERSSREGRCGHWGGGMFFPSHRAMERTQTARGHVGWHVSCAGRLGLIV